MDYMNLILDSLYKATVEKHAELGLPPVSKEAFDKLRPEANGPIVPGFGGDVTEAV
jgi:hypothetical protein